MGLLTDWGGGGLANRPHLSKICNTYPTLMKRGTVIPYLKKIQKIHVIHLMSSADLCIFSMKSAIFSISGNTDIDCILSHKF